MGTFNSDIKAEVFIETGTYLGESLALASEKYALCHSVELDRKLYLGAVKRFAQVSNVKVYSGSSVEILPNIIDPAKKTIFWLDAHYMPGGEPCDIQCPLMDELKAIMENHWSEMPVILIDDAYLFHNEFWDKPEEVVEWQGHKLPGYVNCGDKYALRTGLERDKWPTIDEIKLFLSDYAIRVEGDTIVCQYASFRLPRVYLPC